MLISEHWLVRFCSHPCLKANEEIMSLSSCCLKRNVSWWVLATTLFRKTAKAQITNGFINSIWFLKTSLDRYSASVDETSLHHPPTIHRSSQQGFHPSRQNSSPRVKDNNNNNKKAGNKDLEAVNLVPGVSNNWKSNIVVGCVEHQSPSCLNKQDHLKNVKKVNKILYLSSKK